MNKIVSTVPTFPARWDLFPSTTISPSNTPPPTPYINLCAAHLNALTTMCRRTAEECQGPNKGSRNALLVSNWLPFRHLLLLLLKGLQSFFHRTRGWSGWCSHQINLYSYEEERWLLFPYSTLFHAWVSSSFKTLPCWWISCVFRGGVPSTDWPTDSHRLDSLPSFRN